MGVLAQAVPFIWPYREDPVGNSKEALRKSRAIRSKELETLSYFLEGNRNIESVSVCDMRETKLLLCYVTEIFVLYFRTDYITYPD